MKKLIIISSLVIGLYANSVVDTDLDGVADNMDKCPNTPFLELVDKNGCSKKQLKSKFKATITFGYEYDKNDGYDDSDLIFTSISSKYNKFYFSYFYSQINSQSNDSILSFYYKHKLNSINLKMGIKYYMTTDLNNDSDYAFKIKASYYKQYNYSLSLKHKIYGESGTNDKDTITFEIGKTIKKWYISPYIYTENSKYDSNDWTNYLGVFSQYTINKKLFTSFDISTQLDNTDQMTFVASLGYKF